MCKVDAGNFKVGGGLNLGGLGEDLKKSLGGGNWTKRLGIQMDTTTLNQFKNNPLNTIAGAGKNIQSNIDWAKNRIGPNAWDKGQWAKDRLGIGGMEGGKLWKRSGLDADFAKEGLGGGDWMTRLGLGDYSKNVLGHWGDELNKAGSGLIEGLKTGMPAFHKNFGQGEWLNRLGAGQWQKDVVGHWGKELDKGWEDIKGWQGGGWQKGIEGGNWMDRFGIKDEYQEFNKAWGGGAWVDDRLGLGQFNKKGGGGGADTGDEPTSTTPNTTNPEEEPIDEQMNQLTNEDPQEAARLAATRARRRRALKNKFGKRQTIRTSGRGASGY